MNNTRYIIFLDEKDDADSLSLVGVRAARLSLLTQSGFPVPAGFAVTTDAWRDCVETNPAWPGIVEQLEGRRNLNGDELIKRGAEIRDIVVNSEILKPAAEAIYNAYLTLGDGSEFTETAIRSSAISTGENQSFPNGLFDSFVCVQGIEAVFETVRRVWAGAFTDRVLNYLSRSGASNNYFQMAVVVQKMAPADITGVVETRDPISKAGDRIAVQARRGPFQNVSKSSGDTEIFVVTREDWQLDERRLSGNRPSGLSEEAACALARLSCRMEDLFGSAQTVEWGAEGGDARIIDSQALEERPKQRSEAAWTAHPFAGFFNGTITPFTKSVVGPILEKAIHQAVAELGTPTSDDVNFIGDIHGRFYVNSSLLKDKLNRAGIEPLENETRRSLSKLITATLRAKSDVARLRKQLNRFLENIADRENIIVRSDLRGKSDAALYLLFDKSIDGLTGSAMSLYQLAEFRSNRAHAVLENILAYSGVKNVPATHSEILMGAHDNHMVIGAWKLARLAASIDGVTEKIRSAKNWGELEADLARKEGGKLFLKRLKSFLDRYGDISAGRFELSSPRWSETPDELCALIYSIASAGETPDPETRKQTAASKAKEAQRKTMKRVNIGAGRLLKIALKSAKDADAVKFKSADFVARFLADIRALALETARRFKSRKLIGKEDDLFLLTIEEIKKELAMEKRDYELADVIEERREQFIGQSENAPAPFEIPEPEENDPAENLYLSERILYGKTACSGSYTGAARIVTDPTLTGYLKSGDVLVVRETDDCIAPLLTVAGAVIVESDSLLSRVAATCRLFGTTCIVAAPKVCDRIEVGDVVNIDGVEGKITVMKLYE